MHQEKKVWGQPGLPCHRPQPPCPLSAPLTSTHSHHAYRWQNKSCWRDSSFHLCSPPTLSFSPTFFKPFTQSLGFFFHKLPRDMHERASKGHPCQKMVGFSPTAISRHPYRWALVVCFLISPFIPLWSEPHSKSKIKVFNWCLHSFLLRTTLRDLIWLITNQKHHPKGENIMVVIQGSILFC